MSLNLFHHNEYVSMIVAIIATALFMKVRVFNQRQFGMAIHIKHTFKKLIWIKVFSLWGVPVRLAWSRIAGALSIITFTDVRPPSRFAQSLFVRVHCDCESLLRV